MRQERGQKKHKKMEESRRPSAEQRQWPVHGAMVTMTKIKVDGHQENAMKAMSRQQSRESSLTCPILSRFLSDHPEGELSSCRSKHAVPTTKRPVVDVKSYK